MNDECTACGTVGNMDGFACDGRMLYDNEYVGFWIGSAGVTNGWTVGETGAKFENVYGESEFWL